MTDLMRVTRFVILDIYIYLYSTTLGWNLMTLKIGQFSMLIRETTDKIWFPDKMKLKH
jgi:hypothetical protein